jgi:hypothetical protein
MDRSGRGDIMRRVALNTFRISPERNQAGKWAVRIEAFYAASKWKLNVYFVAGSPRRLVSRLQTVLRYLQREEEQLWLWGSDASDRELLFGQLLSDAGVQLDRRKDFPRRAMVFSVAPGRPLASSQFAELKRKLTQRLAPAPRVTLRTPAKLRYSA